MAENVCYLYINGLGDGYTTPKDKLVSWWWLRKNLTIEHAHVNWYDGESFDEKLSQIETMVDEMLRTSGGVAIIGSSAGGSLALNTLFAMRDKNVCAVVAHGRIKAGDYPKAHRMSLFHRAHLDTDKPSQAFFDSVTHCENTTLQAMSSTDKKRVLLLTQLNDMVVPMNCMRDDELSEHRSLAFGHSGGFLAHLLADRDFDCRFCKQYTHIVTRCCLVV